MNLTKIFLLVCTALAATYCAAQSNDAAHTPLQVPAKTLPVPTDVSPGMQTIIAAPRNPNWNQLWKTGEEWRTAANAQAAKSVQALPAMRERLHVTVRPETMDGVRVYVVTPDVIPPNTATNSSFMYTEAVMNSFLVSREQPRQSSWRGWDTSK
jgi:epsilon-lactone hydrolase